MYDKIVVVTRKTRLRQLIERFNTKGQAKFYIEHSGGDFSEYELEDETFHRALDSIQKQLRSFDQTTQYIDREHISNFVFSKTDLIVVMGQDGLVANTAKYAGEQPVIGINPDPSRYDGILVPNSVASAAACIESTLNSKAAYRNVTLAQAELNDGQRLLAFNDLFIGARTHVSARYRLQFGERSEDQSSSGVLISTGAGSTGWLSSVFNMLSGVGGYMGSANTGRVQMGWEDPNLMFVVREPFISRHSSADVVAGLVGKGAELLIESRMPSGGAIFSDGVEQDFIPFNSGAIVRIGVANHQCCLVVGAQTSANERQGKQLIAV